MSFIAINEVFYYLKECLLSHVKTDVIRGVSFSSSDVSKIEFELWWYTPLIPALWEVEAG